MEIILNGAKEVIPASRSVLELLQDLELNPEIVRVDLNGRLLARAAFSETILQEGDRVEVLLFLGGGA